MAFTFNCYLDFPSNVFSTELILHLHVFYWQEKELAKGWYYVVEGCCLIISGTGHKFPVDDSSQ